MSRKPNLVDDSVLDALKNQVKARTNLECNSSADMQLLQQEIRKTMNQYLSLQTLNRLFGIIRNDFHPSLHTLNVLSQYLQFNSFHEFALLNEIPKHVEKQVSFETKFIFSVFSSVDPGQDDAQAWRTVIRNILHIINDDYLMAAGMYSAMASLPFGRKYFFEQHINMDGLAKNYGDGLHYYLLYAQNRRDQFFAYNLLCLRYFLTADQELLNRYRTLINGFSREEIRTFPAAHSGHFLATMILSQSAEVNLPGKNLAAPDISWYYDEMLLQGNTNDVHVAWYMVTEALVLVGEFDKAWQKLNYHLQPDVLTNRDDEDLLTQIKILRLISGFYSGNIRLHQARQIFAELNAKPLNTIVQNYFSLLLLTLKKIYLQEQLTGKKTVMSFNN
jgi:hypothetical protein